MQTGRAAEEATKALIGWFRGAHFAARGVCCSALSIKPAAELIADCSGRETSCCMGQPGGRFLILGRHRQKVLKVNFVIVTTFLAAFRERESEGEAKLERG